MILLAIASGLVGGIVMYGVRGWEQRAIERLNASGTPFDAVVTEQHDEYKHAAHHTDDLDGFEPTDRAFVAAMRAIDKALVFADDGCFLSDHDLGVHSVWQGKVLPLQRDGRRS